MIFSWYFGLLARFLEMSNRLTSGKNYDFSPVKQASCLYFYQMSNNYQSFILNSKFLTMTIAGIETQDYCVFGLATYFVREEGETKEVKIIEPITSAALEALCKNIPTSYEGAIALRVGDIINGDNLVKPSQFPSEATFCEEFINRTFASTRTYKNNPSAKELINLGECKTDFNYSTERKRILNSVNTVSDDDNVKQHPNTHKRL